MIRTVVQFCIRERLIVLLLAAATIGFGWWCVQEVPIDAIPDVGENQVIVFTSWPGRSPKDVEDQVTYPLSVSLLAVPGAESVRGKSMFGYSFVQITFDDAVDFYWARSRVAEQLTTVAAQLPDGVAPTLGPDATGLGQVLYYTLDAPPGTNLADLRSLQDFVVKFELQAVEGVAEVASVGGYVRQYQIEVAPDKLRFHDVPLDQLVKAVRESNTDVGAKTVESSGMEFVIRGKGFIGADRDPQKAIGEIEETVVLSRSGVPVRVKDLGFVQLGPAFRRGAIDFNGSEAVGGVVVMRYGENPRKVIEAVRERMTAIEPGLDGVKFHVVYDRRDLVDETVATLTTALRDEVLVTAAVLLLFLLHLRSSLVVAITLPIAVLMAFIGMYLVGLDANIMSLAGIAIAIGTMVDMGIIVSENVYRRLADWEAAGSPGGERARLKEILDATTEVAPAVVTAVSTTVISFLPVFFLTGRDYKLFAPLAWTKTFALVASLLVAVLLVPLLARLLLKTARRTRRRSTLIALAAATFAAAAVGTWAAVEKPGFSEEAGLLSGVLLAVAGGTFLLFYMLVRERLRPVEQSPVSRFVAWAYEPTLRTFLRHKLLFAVLPVSIVGLGLGAWLGLHTLLWPVEKATEAVGANLNGMPGYVAFKHTFQGLPSDDWIALDEGSWFYMPTLYPAASFSQAMEVLQTQDTLIREIPEVRDVLGKIGRVESALDPAPAAMIETYVMLEPRETWREGWNENRIWAEINRVATLPGVTPATKLQPIEGRVVMLQSGIKAPMAIRIYGDDLAELATASAAVADHLRELPWVDSGTVNPDIVLGKPYVEFEVDRKTAARYGMSTMMVNQIVESALGGANVTRTVEGRERYTIQVRYERRWREHIEELDRLPVVTHTGEVVPLGMLTKMKTTWGPGMIGSEDARLVAHVAFAPSGRAGDLETVEAVETSLHDAMRLPPGDPHRLALPEGYVVRAVGSFENQIEANRRLLIIVPLVILVNLFVIYLQFRNLPISLAVFAGIPVAFGGGMILLAIYGVEMNTAVWIGFIALFGIAIDDGVVMATYLDQVFRERRLTTIVEIRDATTFAGLKRIRPCLMTTFTTIAALIPVLLSTGRGADVARAMALPVFGGMLVELVTLFVVPVLFCGYMELKLKAGLADDYWPAHPTETT